MILPEIRIQDGWLLRENASRYLHELWGKGSPLADDDWMERRVKQYQGAWKPHEKKIVEAMCKATDLQFRQNIIDVYIAPWFNAFSAPMVMGVMREPDQFIDTLTHELCHRLLTDNTSVSFSIDLVSRWKKLFGDTHAFGVLVHIPVHAIAQYIYLDILQEPKRLERDIAENKDNDMKDYITAWEYVEQHDYKKIIDQLKEDYSHGD